MNSKKGFSLTLIVAILAILAIGAVLFVTKNKKVEAPIIVNSNLTTQISTSSIETKDWNIYTNSNFGWEVRLPLAYEIQNNKVSFVKKMDANYTKTFFGSETPVSVVEIRELLKKPGNISMFDYVNTVLAKPYYDSGLDVETTHIRNVNVVNINNKQYVTADNSGFEGCPSTGYYIEKDSTHYIELSLIKCYGLKDGVLDSIKNIETKEFTTILSTFKFINTQIVSTSTQLTPKPVACTMDAMMCPDGTYVGRSGSKCEFMCPIVNSKVFDCVKDYELEKNKYGENIAPGYIVVGFYSSTTLSVARDIIKSYSLVPQDTSVFYSKLNVNVEKGNEFFWSCKLKQDSRVRYAEPSPSISIAN
jgi:hypothetical protein